MKKNILLFCGGWLLIAIPRMIGIIETKPKFFYLIFSIDSIVLAIFLYTLFLTIRKKMKGTKNDY